MIKAFHKDPYLREVICRSAKQSKAFIETGTHRGSSLKYISYHCPNTICYSCEPVPRLYKRAYNKLEQATNVKIFNLDSLSFMKQLNLDKSKFYTIWLDAHGAGFKWPLREEVKFFSSFNNINMFIDDFKIPFNSNAKYDTWENQECSFEYIKDCINGKYRIYYPNYSLKVGWCLITNCELEMIQGNLIEYDHFT